MQFNVQQIDYTGVPDNFSLGLVDFFKLISMKNTSLEELKNMKSKLTSYKSIKDSDDFISDYFIEISDDNKITYGFTNSKTSKFIKFFYRKSKVIFIFFILLVFTSSVFADVYKDNPKVKQVQMEYMQDCKETEEDYLNLWNSYKVYSPGLGKHVKTEYAHRYKHGYLEGGFPMNETTYAKIACGALYSALNEDPGWIFYKNKNIGLKAWNSQTGRVIMTNKDMKITTSYYKKYTPDWEEIPEKVEATDVIEETATSIIKQFVINAGKNVLRAIIIILTSTA